MILLPLLPLLCLLSPGFGPASAQDTRPNNMVTVSEGEEAVLKCDLSSENSVRRATFDWRKNYGEHEVFEYDDGKYSGSGLNSQNYLFAGRVELFNKDKVASGNASIKIKNTRLKDTGTYTCLIMNPLTSVVNISLNVVGVLKTRSDVSGAAPVPYTNQTYLGNDRVLLECKAHGVPKPEVEWRDSSGKALTAENKHEYNTSGRFYVEIQVNVTRSDLYTCVVNQSSIYHQIRATVNVFVPDVVMVSEGDDAVLPCSLDSKENIENMVFSWRKGHERVFLYDKGRPQYDGPLTGRITHFQDELKSGNASIKILKTQLSDNGPYSCHYSHIQKSYIFLTVGGKKDNPRDNNWTVAITFIILFVCAFAALIGLIGYNRYKKRQSVAEQKKKSMVSTSLSEPLNSQS